MPEKISSLVDMVSGFGFRASLNKSADWWVIQKISRLVDMVNTRFGSSVTKLAILDCELRSDDVIMDVIRYA